MPGRFVLLGLATARSSWFREVSRWSTTAMVPIEFVKAMSVEEVRARLGGGRAHSALLVDSDVPGVDRDLIEAARERACAVIVVTGERAQRDWVQLGASAALRPGFQPGDLVHLLGQVATPVQRPPVLRDERSADGASTAAFRGRLVVVTGPGGAGSSTTAIGLAQHLARDPRYAGHVCLADLALSGEQAMLHASPDVVPGIVELVDAHRAGEATADAVRELTWAVPERGYQLLLGPRRHRDWVSMRPRAVDVALGALRSSFRAVVADTDPDVEGEAETGSLDVEDRNALARSAIGHADVVVVVGRPGMKGLHSLVRCARDLVDFGVAPARLVAVVNAAPRRARARAVLVDALRQLLGAGVAEVAPAPVLLGDHRHLDDRLVEGSALPEGWITPLGRAVARLLDDGTAPVPVDDRRAPVRIEPGTLGSWTEQGLPAGEVG